MSWQGIEGHDDVVDRFRRILASGRLASTFLFVGPAGIGKRTFALKLAQSLLCERAADVNLDPCGSCPSCQQVVAESHPDLELVSKPADKAFIPVEVFIGDREHRMRDGLCHNIALKPFLGGRKIAIIDDADYLNQEGANCLLKTLEEPPANSLIILIASSEQTQLPTIRSRCQVIRFRELPHSVVVRLLATLGEVESDVEAEQLAAFSQGSLQRAKQFGEPDLRAFRDEFLTRLGQLPSASVALAADLGKFVESAGKDAPIRRERLKLVVLVAIEFYRAMIRQLNGLSPTGDSGLQAFIGDDLRAQNVDPETVAACIERCLDAQSQVEANANQATLIECWIDDLARLFQSAYA
ncbi:MAG: DNA polymerase III subunit [Planctomycetaceae bacterium]|nr:DNA polymerase III subunit [Planctomycetales bacterium]MCB9923454.1 DNA polymerase III subunit [Planctomycetaceae bacterium]